MSDASTRRKWRRWLEVLKPEVSDLVIARHFYTEVGRIVTANKRVQTPADFHHWLSRNYAFCMAIGIRRLTDSDTRSISLIRLLQDIQRHPTIATRAYHVRRYQPRLRNAGERWFDMFAGKAGALYLPPSVPQGHIRRIRRVEARVRTFVNQRIAHLDKRNTRRRPLKLQEIYDAVDLLERVYLDYSLLLAAAAPSTLLPTWQYDWQEIFARPWITNPPPAWSR